MGDGIDSTSFALTGSCKEIVDPVEHTPSPVVSVRVGVLRRDRLTEIRVDWDGDAMGGVIGSNRAEYPLSPTVLVLEVSSATEIGSEMVGEVEWVAGGVLDVVARVCDRSDDDGTISKGCDVSASNLRPSWAV